MPRDKAVQQQEEAGALAYLRTPEAIRERCAQLLELAYADALQHFAYQPAQLEAAAAYVLDITRATYPSLDIPCHSRWRHFHAGGVDRVAQLTQRLAGLDVAERTRSAIELVVTSVLLDAGAGDLWRYREATTGQIYARSEGLAVASFDLFMAGMLSSYPERPWQADAAGLQQITAATLAEAFQVQAGNPLVGFAGRLTLLHRLGQVVAHAPQYFGAVAPRLGNLYDALRAQAIHGTLPARRILALLLDSLGPIWPGRLTLGGVNLGDVWLHRQVTGNGLSRGLVPLHKLSQWLTYSLIEPLQDAGLVIEGLDALTGLAEYRNGGLFLDLGVLTPKHAAVLEKVHTPADEVVVEWRALTVALLDELAERLRQMLGHTAEALPLVKILEGGTWRAGRAIARTRRADGRPPLSIASDGTVF
jgi:Protein of unknown function (DUF1688)